MRSGLMNEQNKRKHIIGQLAELRSSNDKLIQIARSIVVYGAPDKVPEITRRFFNSHCTSANSVELTACLEREVGKKSLSNIARRAILRKIERCCLSFMLSVIMSPINRLLKNSKFTFRQAQGELRRA